MQSKYALWSDLVMTGRQTNKEFACTFLTRDVKANSQSTDRRSVSSHGLLQSPWMAGEGMTADEQKRVKIQDDGFDFEKLSWSVVLNLAKTGVMVRLENIS